jgi:hypothetical protein
MGQARHPDTILADESAIHRKRVFFGKELFSDRTSEPPRVVPQDKAFYRN